MERHLRSRRARGRLVLVATLAQVACGCVPIAPFERPAHDPGAGGHEASTEAPARLPDLPERGDQRVATAPEPAAPVSVPAAPLQEAHPTAEPPAPQIDEDPQRAQVRLQLQSYYEAYNAREWKRAHGHFWEGATVTDVRMLPDQSAPTVQISPVTEFFAELERAGEAPPEGFEGRLEGLPEVRAASNVAQAWCHFRASFGGPQESMSWRRVDAFTFVLHDGVWKISSLAQSKSFDAPQER
jgi:hypothetical protein